MNKRVNTSTLRTYGAVLGVCLALGVILSLSRGQSNWWDILNYHIYNPWSLFNHRESKDLFAAGIQGYFNPIADIPYYLISMVWFPGHPRLVAALAGLPFGLLIFSTVLLIRSVFSGFRFNGSLERWSLICISTAVAVTGVSTWSQAITTTNEVSVAVLVMMSITLLVGSFASTSPSDMGLRRSMAIGSLLGLAAGLKLTAAIYAPAGGLILLAACRDWRQALRCGIVFFCAWMGLFLLSWGPWAWHLYQRTGNPFFPMFNNIFHSNYSAQNGGRDIRFMPHGLEQWLLYPLYWLDNKRRTVYPLVFRDARLAAAYLLGIAALVRAWIVRHRTLDDRQSTLISLTGFWFIAYATWLAMFSMLRYAIVIEVSASIVSIGTLLYFIQSRSGKTKTPVRLLLVFVFAGAMIGFAQIPDMGHVAFGDRVYASSVPALGRKPLVILGNQPMGILAPLIVRSNPDATFVGLPTCFAQGGWCYKGFYNYGLGQKIRKKIARHRGSIYVAYYANRIPVMPQLRKFGIQLTSAHCSVMQTNRTQNVLLCPAHFIKNSIAFKPENNLYHLALHTKHLRHDVRIEGAWQSNKCTKQGTSAKLALHWDMPSDIKHVRVYVKSKPSMKTTLFAKTPNKGHAVTGNWVHAGLTFLYMDENGNTLAESNVYYAQCDQPRSDPL